jgi:putative selenium metabolism protein SsnA
VFSGAGSSPSGKPLAFAVPTGGKDCVLLIGNGRVITRDGGQPYLPDGCVAIRENLIAEIGPTREIRDRYPGSVFVDAGGKVIMPGLINTHTHLYSAFARGLALKDPSPANFQEILERLWWRLDKVLTLEDVYWSALTLLVECVRNGTTTLFDHHASPGAVRDSLFTIEKAARAAGVRTCLCYEVSDRDGKEVAEQGIRENIAFINHCRQARDELTKGMFGLHASLTLGDETLSRCREENAGTEAGFHIHAAEGQVDLEQCLARHGRRVIERLSDSAILGSRTIAAHCVHVDYREMDLLRDSGTRVVHNPESNMANAVGCAPVIDMVRRGVSVGLGTDGYTCDMFESLKAANLLHKHHLSDPRAGWAEAPEMLFGNNSRICGEYFSKPLGRLAAGAYADVIVVDYDLPTPLDEGNLNSHILFGMSGPMVDTTVINGRVVMQKRHLADIDEAAIRARSRERAADVWKRF